MRTEESILTYTELNQIITQIKIFASGLKIPENLSLKNNGDFLFCEDSEEIERVLKLISDLIYIDYEKRFFYNLSTLTYEDVNRWESQIDLIDKQLDYIEENAYLYSAYTSNTYEDLENKTYKEIMFGEEK